MVDHSLIAGRFLEVAVDGQFALDEADFRRLYDATVHPLRAYLTQMSGDVSLADDLSQEAYCRFLQVAQPPPDADGRRRYVFRIATNLLRDHWRRTRRDRHMNPTAEPADHDVEQRLHLATDVSKVLQRLTPRQRALLWLAYVEGLQHREIAGVLGLTVLSVRPLLFRARRRLARELRSRGLGTEA